MIASYITVPPLPPTPVNWWSCHVFTSVAMMGSWGFYGYIDKCDPVLKPCGWGRFVQPVTDL